MEVATASSGNVYPLHWRTSDNLQMDLTNLGAKELIRYDFGHCPIDKVTFIFMYYIQKDLDIVWIVKLLQENVRTCDNVSDENRQTILAM